MENLTTIYYDLFEILDDVELFAEAINHFCIKKYSKRKVMNLLEDLKLHKLEKELNELYDQPINNLKSFKVSFYYKGQQTIMEDFI